MSRSRKYPVNLSKAEESKLHHLISTGHHASSEILHAHILLQVSGGMSNPYIMQTFSISEGTVALVCKRYHQGGLKQALYRKKRNTPPNEPVLDGDGEAYLIALACSEAPKGYARWTLRLLAKHIVRLEIVDHICPETVRKTLKKTNYTLIK